MLQKSIRCSLLAARVFIHCSFAVLIKLIPESKRIRITVRLMAYDFIARCLPQLVS